MSGTEKVNVLLVDDEPDKQVALEAVLADLQENVVRVNTGEQALEYLLRHECAVIVLDVNLPGIDGFETAHLIRQRPSLEHTPIIFVSAYNVTDPDRMRGYGLGAVDYLFVPVVPEVLRTKVQVFVELFRQRRIIAQQAASLAAQNAEKEEQIRVIQLLNTQLQAANQELETFSYTVSHDLRAPLRAVRGYAEILQSDYAAQLPGEAADYLRRMAQAAGRMDALIHDILAYTRLSKDEMALETVDLDPLVRSLVEASDELRPPRAEVIIERPLLTVMAHEACLTQCLTNLLGNAVKFVRKGETPVVRVLSERRAERVRIWIEDNGIGIAPAHRARVFEMFGRVHSTTDYEGNGIGLTVVKRGVERMNGAVGVESELGRGSRFWIELAAADPPAGTAGSAQDLGLRPREPEEVGGQDAVHFP